MARYYRRLQVNLTGNELQLKLLWRERIASTVEKDGVL